VAAAAYLIGTLTLLAALRGGGGTAEARATP
jgi:hypothetical protein